MVGDGAPTTLSPQRGRPSANVVPGHEQLRPDRVFVLVERRQQVVNRQGVCKQRVSGVSCRIGGRSMRSSGEGVHVFNLECGERAVEPPWVPRQSPVVHAMPARPEDRLSSLASLADALLDAAIISAPAGV